MYLKDGREIYESDKYPGYYICSENGNFCDSKGNYVGGNSDMGDKPGHTMEYVWVSRTGKYFYDRPTKSATTRMTKMEALKVGYRKRRKT